MTQVELCNGIRYLKAYYPKWDLNIGDSFVLDVWYDSLNEISYDAFKGILKDYCKSNSFPPASPTDILKMIPILMSVEDAWNYIVDMVGRNQTQEFFMKEMYSNNKLIYGFVKKYDFYKCETDSFNHRCLGYEIGRTFKREYIEYLNSLKVKYINNRITNNQLLLS